MTSRAMTVSEPERAGIGVCMGRNRSTIVSYSIPANAPRFGLRRMGPSQRCLAWGDGRGSRRLASPSITPAATPPRDTANPDFFRTTPPAAHRADPPAAYDGGRGQAPEHQPEPEPRTRTPSPPPSALWSGQERPTGDGGPA